MPEYDPSSDPRSSNALIHGYLASKGLQPTAENVRRALEANYANPGLIQNDASTLTNQGPAAPDIAAAVARGGGARGSPTASAAPVAPNATPTAGGGGGGDTSTPPENGGDFPYLQAILGGAGAGLGLWGASRFKRGGPGEAVPGGGVAGEPGLPDIRLELNKPQIASQPAQIGRDGAQLRLGGPGVGPEIPGVASPQLLPSQARLGQLAGPGPQFQLSGPDAQFQVGGPEPQARLPAPLDSRPVANPNEAIPAPRPGPPDVIEAGKPTVRVQAGSAPITDPLIGAALDKAVPVEEVAAPSARARKPRASRARAVVRG